MRIQVEPIRTLFSFWRLRERFGYESKTGSKSNCRYQPKLEWGLKTGSCAVFEDYTVMKAEEADAQAGACHWHQSGTSKTYRSPAREEATQDRILAALERELTLPKEILFL